MGIIYSVKKVMVFDPPKRKDLVMTKWSEEFHKTLNSSGKKYNIINRVNGWIETSIIMNKTFFVKSATYNQNRYQYFQGVDPRKLNDRGDYILFCGGRNNNIKDIFIIPWDLFFTCLKKGVPINTFKPPKKEYFQYKFYLSDKIGKWFLYVQPTQKTNPQEMDQYHYDINEAINNLPI